jgi:hypothetical protein
VEDDAEPNERRIHGDVHAFELREDEVARLADEADLANEGGAARSSSASASAIGTPDEGDISPRFG